MMRRHARVVLLLSGWLLMMPPAARNKDGEWDILDAAPKSAWEQLAAYDTARECETGRASDPRPQPKLNPTKLGMSNVEVEAIEERLAIDSIRRLAARCVPAEHIYPPKAAESK